MRKVNKLLLVLQANTIKTKVEMGHWQYTMLSHILIVLRTNKIHPGFDVLFWLWINVQFHHQLSAKRMLFFLPHRWILQFRSEIWSCFWNTSPKQLRNPTAWPQREWRVPEHAHEKWTGIVKVTSPPLPWLVSLPPTWALLHADFVLQICH